MTTVRILRRCGRVISNERRAAFSSSLVRLAATYSPMRTGDYQPRWYSSTPRTGYRLTFIEPSGEEIDVDFEEGDTILDVALDNDIEIEGACGGECACSTCHVILDKENFDLLEEPDEEEEDMLDLALGLTDTSRLGCQIKLTSNENGMRVTLPAETESMLS